MSEAAKESCTLTPCMSKSNKQDGTKNKTNSKLNEKVDSSALVSSPARAISPENLTNQQSGEQDPNEDLLGKPMLFTGVVAVGVIKKILLPSACASVAAAAVGQSSGTDGDKKGEKTLVRPRDLPIYSSEPVKKKCQPKDHGEDSMVASTVRQIREGTWAVLDQAKVLTNQACDILETGKAHTASTINYLREEENAIPRYGAIGLGGLAGLLLSLRRGIFKRILYTTTGAVGMAAILYPQEAREYSSEGVKMAKKYIIVGYHFINGDNPKEEKKLKRKSDKMITTKSKKQSTEKPAEPDCLCPDKNNICPDPVPNENGKNQ